MRRCHQRRRPLAAELSVMWQSTRGLKAGADQHGGRSTRGPLNTGAAQRGGRSTRGPLSAGAAQRGCRAWLSPRTRLVDSGNTSWLSPQRGSLHRPVRVCVGGWHAARPPAPTPAQLRRRSARLTHQSSSIRAAGHACGACMRCGAAIHLPGDTLGTILLQVTATAHCAVGRAPLCSVPQHAAQRMRLCRGQILVLC